MRKPVDPVHFFNSRGVSILLAEDQSEEIKLLKARIALRDKTIKMLTQRLKSRSDDSENPN